MAYNEITIAAAMLLRVRADVLHTPSF